MKLDLKQQNIVVNALRVTADLYGAMEEGFSESDRAMVVQRGGAKAYYDLANEIERAGDCRVVKSDKVVDAILEYRRGIGKDTKNAMREARNKYMEPGPSGTSAIFPHKDSDGRWRPSCSTFIAGIVTVGYCDALFTQGLEAETRSKYHNDGHASQSEAMQCYANYLSRNSRSDLFFSRDCPPPLEGHRGPENRLLRICGWFWKRDLFWIAWRISDLYRISYSPQTNACRMRTGLQKLLFRWAYSTGGWFGDMLYNLAVWIEP